MLQQRAVRAILKITSWYCGISLLKAREATTLLTWFRLLALKAANLEVFSFNRLDRTWGSGAYHLPKEQNMLKIEKASNGGWKIHRHNKIPDPSCTRHKVPPWQKVETEPKPNSTKWSAKCLRGHHVTLTQTSLNLVIKQPYSACVHETFVHLPLSKTNLSNVDSRALFLSQSKTSSVSISRGVSLQEKQGTKSINKCNTTTIIKWSGI